MILWPIFALMTVGAVVAVWLPLARRQRSVRSGSDIAVYRDQLAEIDRDEASSLIGKVEAEAARVEVSRRLIAAAEAAKAATLVAAPLPGSLYRRATLAAAVVLLPLGAGAIYFSLGSPNLVPVSMNAATNGQPTANRFRAGSRRRLPRSRPILRAIHGTGRAGNCWHRSISVSDASMMPSGHAATHWRFLVPTQRAWAISAKPW